MSPPLPQSARVAWVTGASGGIGQAVALALAECGHPVGLQTHSHDTPAQDTLRRIQTRGGQGLVVSGDVSNPDDAKRIAAIIAEQLGPPLILVNAAGAIQTQFLALTRPEAWREMLAVNLDGACFTLQAAMRGMMRARWGRVINIGSVAGLTGDLMRSGYAAAKAGLAGVTMTAARELASAGITVNLVAPGLVDTAMTADMPETRRRKLLAQIPLNRFGRPEEIAGAISFLCSDTAAYITGETLVVDGGLYMRR